MIKRIEIADGSNHTNTIRSFTPLAGGKLRLIVKGTNPSIVIKQSVSADDATTHTLSTVTAEGVADINIFPNRKITFDITGTSLYLHAVEIADLEN